MVRQLTLKEKSRFLRDDSTWPICKYCKSKIPPTAKKRVDGSIPWFTWLEDTVFCNRTCSQRFRRSAEKQQPVSKTCAQCGKRIKRKNETSTQWLRTKYCLEHRKKTNAYKELRDDGSVTNSDAAMGLPITTGMYIFEMRKPDTHDRKSVLRCIPEGKCAARDKKIDRICSDYKNI